MGTIDSTSHIFNCQKCNTIDTITVYEKGSSYGASWGQPSESVQFSVQWERNAFGEPSPISAVCKKCGANAMPMPPSSRKSDAS